MARATEVNMPSMTDPGMHDPSRGILSYVTFSVECRHLIPNPPALGFRLEKSNVVASPSSRLPACNPASYLAVLPGGSLEAAACEAVTIFEVCWGVQRSVALTRFRKDLGNWRAAN